MLGAILQTKLTHRINNASLHRLEAVTNMRERTIENDVHRVIEVGLLGVIAQGNFFEIVSHESNLCQVAFIFQPVLTIASALFR